MEVLIRDIEAILFVASKPLSLKKIARALQKDEEEVTTALEQLKAKYTVPTSGIHIISVEDEVQMATNAECSAAITSFVKDETAGELTRAQLETLTVVAYRGPVTRPELEQIRGVNCAVILRSLLIRGLIEENEDTTKVVPVYTLSFEAMRHLGLTTVSELPEYMTLHSHEHIAEVLKTDHESAQPPQSV